MGRGKDEGLKILGAVAGLGGPWEEGCLQPGQRLAPGDEGRREEGASKQERDGESTPRRETQACAVDSGQWPFRFLFLRCPCHGKWEQPWALLAGGPCVYNPRAGPDGPPTLSSRAGGLFTSGVCLPEDQTLSSRPQTPCLPLAVGDKLRAHPKSTAQKPQLLGAVEPGRLGAKCLLEVLLHRHASLGRAGTASRGVLGTLGLESCGWQSPSCPRPWFPALGGRG